MKYFITVSPLTSTTKLGQILADIVMKKYHNALIFHGEANMMPQWIYQQMTKILALNKRLKPMQIQTHGYLAGTSRKLPDGAPASIWLVTAAGSKAFTDNRPFTIHLTPVRKDYTGASISTGKGGEA